MAADSETRKQGGDHRSLEEQAAWVLGHGSHQEIQGRQSSKSPTERAQIGAHIPPSWGTSEANYSVGLLFSVEKSGKTIPTLESVKKIKEIRRENIT